MKKLHRYNDFLNEANREEDAWANKQIEDHFKSKEEDKDIDGKYETISEFEEGKNYESENGDDIKINTISDTHISFVKNGSIQDYKNLVNQIHCKQSYFVKMITKRLKNHFVKYQDKFYLVGYDKKTKQICTVLPV